MSQTPLQVLKTQYPSVAAATDPDEDLVLRAILSVTEAISQSNQQTRAFSLFHIDGWNDINGANQDAANQNRAILRPGQPLLLPWKNAKSQIMLVYARFDGQQAAGSTAPTIRLDLYDTGDRNTTDAQKIPIQDRVRDFLRAGGWFGPGTGSLPQIDMYWHVAARTKPNLRHFAVILIAWALALGLQDPSAMFQINAKDRDYTSAVAQGAVNGAASPLALYALLVRLKITDGNFDPNFNGGFAQTLDLRDNNAFGAHWTNVQTAQGSNGPNNGQPPPPLPSVAPPPQPCTHCNVANHCNGSSGTDIVCTDCKIQGHCEAGCSRCTIPSHCIPNVTNAALQGLSYHRSIHAFRPSLPQNKAKLRSENTIQPQGYIAVTDEERLYDHDLVIAITSITEAISRNNRGKVFSLYSDQVYSNSKTQQTQSLRPQDRQDSKSAHWEVVRQRQDLILPVVDSRDLEDWGHISLAVVKNRNDKDYDVDIYNSTPSQTVDDFTKNFVKNFIIWSRWWSRNPNDPVPNGQWTVQPAAEQEGNTSCGIHVILNAWSVALGLQLNDSPNLRRLDYAIETITQAYYGAIDCKTICQLLRLLNWVTDSSVLAPDRQFGLTRAFGARTVLDAYHRFMWDRDRQSTLPNPLVGYMEDLSDCARCIFGHCDDANGRIESFPQTFIIGDPAPASSASTSNSTLNSIHRMDHSSSGGKASRRKTRVGDERHRRRMKKRFLGMEMQRSSKNLGAKRLLEGEIRPLRSSKRRRI